MQIQLNPPVFCRQTLLGVLAFGAWMASQLQAAPATGRFIDKVFRDDSGEHKYVVFVPAAYRADTPSPAIVFLHGAGERGNENRMPLTVGLAPFVQARAQTFPFIVIFPQCETTDGRILESWQSNSADGRRVLAILEAAEKDYRIDERRVVLTGWSMGGYGAWSLAAAEPSRWSAVVPLAGGGDVSRAASLKNVNLWCFHGGKDVLVSVEESRRMVEAVKSAGGNPHYTELPEMGHDISEAVYGNDALVEWMLAPQTKPTDLGPLTVKPVAAINVPFVPAVEMPEAVGFRLGNDALAALAYAIPQKIPKNLLAGSLADMYDSTNVQGRQFSIQFSGISYSGSVQRVLVKGLGRDRLSVQIGIRDVALNIGGTYVTGASHAAQAGPISIIIGQRYPVWLNLEVTPSIVDRKIRLKSIGASFQIPDDNWYVTSPAGVSTQGFGMTEGAVSSGLTNGLYGSKGRIENEVRAIAPGLVKQLEEFLIVPNTETTLSGFWPLPITQPRLKIYPEHIATDENGVTLVVGLTAGSLNPFVPSAPLKQIDPLGISLTNMASDKAFHLSIAPQILEPLTQMVVETDLTKLDLLDIPEPLFAKLADRSNLQVLIPDLKRYGDSLQVRSTLRIVNPLQIGSTSLPASEGGVKPFELKVPGLKIRVAIKTDANQSQWQPCVDFDLNVSEMISVSLRKPTHDLRRIHRNRLTASTIHGTAHFVEGYPTKDRTIHVAAYTEQFLASWQAYNAGEMVSETDVPDLIFGGAKLRLDAIDWNAPALDVSFHLAHIKLTNLSPENFAYETKAPTGDWGETLTLKPGDSHEFELPYPLTYRHGGSSGSEFYTLPVGSHSEFRVPLTGGSPKLFAAKKP